MVLATFLVRRLLIDVGLVLASTLVAFAIYFKLPSDPTYFLTGLPTGGQVDPAATARARAQLGLDDPVLTQYGKFVWRLVHGDLGLSWKTAGTDPTTGELVGAPVSEIVIDAARVTASLALGGAVVLFLLALPLGILAASRANTLVDRTLIAVTLVAISTHPIVVGIVLRVFAADRLGVAPPGGYCGFLADSPGTAGVGALAEPACHGPLDWAHHLVLPWIAFGLFFLALYMRMIRASMLDVLAEPYIRTARAKGASELRVLARHALRNGITPVITMLGMDVALALGIAIYVETVYDLPGLGQLALSAFSGDPGYDLPVISAMVVVITLAIVLLNILVDLACAVIDPRLRESGARVSVLRPTV